MKLKFAALPPADAIKAFLARGGDKRATQGWQQWAAAEHARAFTVAQSMHADILTDVYEALNVTPKEGRTLKQFQAQLEPLLRKKGWWGKKSITDPLTGEIKIVQLGSHRRLETIFQTNLRVSHAVGRARRIKRMAKIAPWLEYIAVRDNRTRDQHKDWHGVILRHDDPWWNTHMPPNGWRCRCTVHQLTDADLERRKLTPAAAPANGSTPWHNKITGETRQIPNGIDPGWDHDAGALGLAQVEGKLKTSITHLAAKGKAPAVAAANILRLDEFIAQGAAIRKPLSAAAGDLEVKDFPVRFRAGLTQRLRAQTGAPVNARVQAKRAGNQPDQAAAKRVIQAAHLLPATWVMRANQAAVTVHYNGQTHGGGYTAATKQLDVSDDPGNALHEYVHHVQHQLPGLDAHYLALHRRRTAEDALEDRLYDAQNVSYGAGTKGRSDAYIDAYFGKEYAPFNAKQQGQPLEAITRAIQILYFPVYGEELLPELIKHDTEMLDLTLGLLFSYKPIP